MRLETDLDLKFTELLNYNFQENFTQSDKVTVHRYVIERLLEDLKTIEKRSPSLEVKKCIGRVESMLFEIRNKK